MRKNYFIQGLIIIFAGLFLGLQNLSAQVYVEKDANGNDYTGILQEGKYYVIWEPNEVSTWEVNKDFTYRYSAPADYIYFRTKRTNTLTASGNLKQMVVTNTSGSYVISTGYSFSSDWVQRMHRIPTSHRSSGTLVLTIAGSEQKFIDQMRVEMAQYLEFDGTTATEQTVNMGSNSSVKVQVNWSNVGNVSITETSDPHGVFSVNVANVAAPFTYATAGKWGHTTYEFTCDFSKMEGEHNGEFTIQDEAGHTLVLKLQSNTITQVPDFAWGSALRIDVAGEGWLSVGETIQKTDVAHISYTTDKAHDVTYSSSNPNVVEVDANGNLIVKAEGSVILTAKVPADTFWEGIDESITIHVTNKNVQTITWKQPALHNLSVGSITSPTATVAPDPSRTLTYTSDNTDVVTIENGALKAVKEGLACVIATQKGDANYTFATCTHMVVVRNTATCEDLLWGVGAFTLEHTVVGGGNQQQVCEFVGEPAELSFTVNNPRILQDVKLFIEIYKDGNWIDEWKTIDLERGETKHTITFSESDRTITKIRFREPYMAAGTGKQQYTNVKITRARYVEADKQSITFANPLFIDAAAKENQSITIKYSSLPDVYFAKIEGNGFSIVSSTEQAGNNGVYPIGVGCASTNSVTLDIRFTADGFTAADLGEKTSYLVVVDAAGTEHLRIPISGKVIKKGQVIEWDPKPEVYVIETITVPAYSTEGLPITYTPDAGTNNVVKITPTPELQNGKWVYPVTILGPGRATFIASQSGSDEVEAAQSITRFFDVILPLAWLAVMPDEEDVMPSSKAIYANLLFAEGENGKHANLAATSDVWVMDNLYYMFRVTDVDDWRIFVPPFKVDNAYVIELIPETEDKIQMIADQNTAYDALYAHLKTKLTTYTVELNLIEIIKAYIATLENAEQLGIYSIDGNDYYNAYKGAAQWEYDGEKLTKSWEQIVPSVMEAKSAYALQFPWCPMCERDEEWHYWTGKLILLQGAGPQTIARVAETPAANASGATLMGNYTLADMTVTNAFVHNTTNDLYEIQDSYTIAPTQSFILADIPAKQGKRAVAITRQGDIIWEEAPDSGDSGVVTDLEAIAQTSLLVTSQAGGFSVVSSVAQAIQIYGIDGSLIYAGEIGASEAQFFSVEAGMYIVRTSTAAYKVFAR